ncbi:ATP-NAD kinase [Thalassotalea insulae]|uniref:ATP-NAD kinase n=1 Tax=Thalassotalea insulae TaxID=2056778 RepID=A0ABQ6GN93_9GAMM|nr:ATP-NAD kinase family protein [Thalassotalea insulae]GLX77448.1 ATP-NAD kinase [Thalassotalea insulae]
MFKLGFVVNPIAGIGGSVALKGSDGEGIAQQAKALGAEAKANSRAALALEVLLPYQQQITVYCANGLMGEQTANELGFNTEVIYHSKSEQTTPQDTENAVAALISQGVDLLLFAGGDGTARNICHKVGDSFPVLGIPAGCKIHSGVYAVTPKAAGRVVELMVTNQLVTLTEADVMDIDESLFRQGVVKAKRYGEMQIPAELRYVQAVKSGGKESDELVLQDIAADVINQMDEQLFIIGSGSTTAFLMEELALDNTLLGVDLVQDQELIASDVIESQLWQAIQDNAENGVKLVITLIGGQGHIFGRGNQQLSPRIIKAIGKDNIIIIATKTKLSALNARPLIADTGDSALDQELSGYLPVTTGYNDQVLYPVASPQ